MKYLPTVLNIKHKLCILEIACHENGLRVLKFSYNYRVILLWKFIISCRPWHKMGGSDNRATCWRAVIIYHLVLPRAL